MQATIYTGSYWEDFRNIGVKNREAYERESRTDGKLVWGKIDIFQLVLRAEGIPRTLISRCLPHKWSRLEDYHSVGEELGEIATQEGIIDYGGIENGRRFNKSDWEIETILRLDAVNIAHFEWGFLSKLPRLIRARIGVQLIGTE